MADPPEGFKIDAPASEPPAGFVIDQPRAAPMTAGAVVKGAITSAPESALRFGQDIVQPFIHPVETAENIGNIGKGVLQKLGIVSGTDSEKYADAVGKFL